MSMLNCSRHIAIFKDSSGEQVGKKVFERVWFSDSIGLTKKYFFFKDRAYNIKNTVKERLNVSTGRTLVFDDYVYTYNIDNPDPIDFSNSYCKPIMNPEDYKQRLDSKLVNDLNKAGRGGFKLNWRVVIGVLVVIAIVYYFASGGTVLGNGTT